jgi:hypothetical protein
MMSSSENQEIKTASEIEESRRNFVEKCGRLALTAPPALALLLSTNGRNYAIAGSYAPGNPGNNNPVGQAGESPNGTDFGSGDRGKSR